MIRAHLLLTLMILRTIKSNEPYDMKWYLIEVERVTQFEVIGIHV